MPVQTACKHKPTLALKLYLEAATYKYTVHSPTFDISGRWYWQVCAAVDHSSLQCQQHTAPWVMTSYDDTQSGPCAAQADADCAWLLRLRAEGLAGNIVSDIRRSTAAATSTARLQMLPRPRVATQSWLAKPPHGSPLRHTRIGGCAQRLE